MLLFAVALAFAQKFGCVLVLKGKATVCAFPDGEAYINTSGSSALAKAGSGDSLAGFLSSLICSPQLSCLEASALAAFVLREGTKAPVRQNANLKFESHE